jgi:hypothetical protein
MTYNFPDHEKSDTMNAVEFQLFIDGDPVDLTSGSVEIKYVLNLKHRSMTIGSGLSFTDATIGKFKVNEQTIDWEKGTWHYEIQFTFADGRKKTYLKGQLKITD